MSRILVTGATGFVGSTLVERLTQQPEFTVKAVARKREALPKTVEGIQITDLNAETNWQKALVDVDVIIHTAARVHMLNDQCADPLAEFRRVNVEGTLHLARQAAIAGVKRFIFLSSVKVNGEETTSGKKFSEADMPSPQDAYGLSKYEAEQGLLALAAQTGLEVVIIRPPLVYGPGVKANFESMMRWVKKGVPLPFGAIYNKRSLVGITNLIEFIIRCIHHPNAVNQIFLISDDCDVSTSELLRGCAKVLGVPSRLISMPQSLLKGVACIVGKHAVIQRLCGSLQIDISKAKRELDWSPVYSVEEGLRATAKQFL
ncbi:MAG: SDR family oxidoreductase [Pseudomonadota bacterium]